MIVGIFSCMPPSFNSGSKYSTACSIVFALEISCGRKYFCLSNNTPTSLIAGISKPSRISPGFVPLESSFFTTSTIPSLFPFKTASNTGFFLIFPSASPTAAFFSFGWFSPFPAVFAAFAIAASFKGSIR